MRNQVFDARTHLNHSPQTVFAWHERDGAFARLSPPWMEVKCIEHTGGIKDGARVVLLLQKGPVRLPWILGHKNYVANERFVDYQIAGPFEYYEQIHETRADGDGTLLIDHAEFRVPMGLAGRVFGGNLIQADLARLFRYRHCLTAADLDLQKKYGGRPLKILVSGGSGLIGSHLIPFLLTQGHKIVQLVRLSSKGDKPPMPTIEEILWDPQNKTIAAPLPEDLDGVVHLSGFNVAGQSWSAGVKRAIEETRVESTAYLVHLLGQVKNPPPVFVCASAVDFYGDRGGEPMTEESSAGEGFLAGVCKRWEAAANKASSIESSTGKHMRVVNLRVSAVLSPKGGALAKLLPVFKAGGGGPVGTGNQYFSWISMDDMLGCIYHALVEESINGPLNAVAPECPTNKQFASTLGRVLGRPALLPLPTAAVQVLFGEMGEALLLASRRLLPQKLKQSGYQFLDPELGEALKYMLGLSARLE